MTNKKRILLLLVLLGAVIFANAQTIVPPTLLTPPDNDVNDNDTGVLLTWTATKGTQPTEYYVSVRRDSAEIHETTLFILVSDTMLYIPNIVKGGEGRRYFRWRVSNGKSSEERKFARSYPTPKEEIPQNSNTLEAPNLIYPEDTIHLEPAVIVNTNFSWSSISDSTKYHLEVARDSTDFKDKIVDIIVVDTTIQVYNLIGLREKTRYFRWRVRGIQGDSIGTWSEERLFSIVYSASNEEDKIPEQSFDVELYPNPVEKTLSLSLKVTKPSQLNISIYDILGRKIGMDASYVLPIGEHQKILSMPSGLPKGFYVLVVQGEHQTLSKTFQVTR